MKYNTSFPPARLKEVLDYDPNTGLFRWKPRSDKGNGWNSRYAGRAAGGVSGRGYLYINVDRHLLKAHRLAWLFMTGEWPNTDIDHIDCVRTNNAWSNLRAANCAQNSRNARLRESNETGFKGVYFDRANCKFRVQVGIGGKNLTFGRYESADEAAMVADAARKRLHGEFARSE